MEDSQTSVKPAGDAAEPVPVAEAFHTHYASLVRYACKFVDLATAEDLVQDVFVLTYNRMPKQAKSYLFSSVHNKCQDHLRRQTVHRKYVSDILTTQQELEHFSPDGPHRSLLEEERSDVWKAIDSLPPRCREIVRLRYEKGMKTPEISETMGISSRTVETQLYKAIKQLRGLLRRVNQFFSWIF